jgi:formate C-acetyltransferase
MQRYGDLAVTLADSEADTQRKEELGEIARVCYNLVEGPPQTFREALQAFWFVNMAVNSVGFISPLGRFDQNLWPFLEQDLENGAITLEEAQELVDLLWLKFSERHQLFKNIESPIELMEKGLEVIRPRLWGGPFLGGKTTTDRGTGGVGGGHYNQFWQTMALSGITTEGKDGTSPLTYLALNATYRLKLAQPEIYLRMHKNSPDELFEWAADLIRNGLINPSIYNDEAVIPAFVKQGIPLKLAREYTPDGCWEAHPQGQAYFKWTSISSLECLDRTLSPHSWWEGLKVPGYAEEFDPFRDVKVPDPYTYRSFNEVMATFERLFDIYIRGLMESIEMMRDGRIADIAPLPLFSALVEGPLESGKDMTQEEGGMKYRQHSLMLYGLSHTADSLAVIKKLCFEEKTVEWKELLDAIHDNWEGKESLRQWVRTRAPAYGNDVDYVDDIAGEIAGFFIERIKIHRAEMGTRIIFAPGIGTLSGFATAGYIIGATPDGRLAKNPVAGNASPSVGRAASGQTAAINSFVKLPNTEIPSGAALDLVIAKRVAGLPEVETLIRTFVEGKGNLLTISVNDISQLRAAQKEPEKYRDLKVRVSGWEAYFVDLPHDIQDWIIQRAEQYA